MPVIGGDISWLLPALNPPRRRPSRVLINAHQAAPGCPHDAELFTLQAHKATLAATEATVDPGEGGREGGGGSPSQPSHPKVTPVQLFPFWWRRRQSSSPHARTHQRARRWCQTQPREKKKSRRARNAENQEVKDKKWNTRTHPQKREVRGRARGGGTAAFGLESRNPKSESPKQ